MIYKFRRLLIRIGKVVPFVLCLLVCSNYTETLLALLTNDYIEWSGVIILNTRLSFFIGNYFEYNVQMLIVLCIISIAVETCIYNKLACVYLSVNLIEKSYFNFELEPTYIYIICTLNIIAAGYLTYKGIKILTSK